MSTSAKSPVIETVSINREGTIQEWHLISVGNNKFELKSRGLNKTIKLNFVDNGKLTVADTDKQEADEVLDYLPELSLKVQEYLTKTFDDIETEEFLNRTVRPYDPDLIRVEQKFISLFQVSNMISEGDIDLTPDFQRNLVWDKARKSKLIESILLKIPLPVFYFSETREGTLHVVDGMQRLSTIHEFMKGDFALKNLEYLSDCEGCFYQTQKRRKVLEDKFIRRINTFQISCNIIDPSSPTEVKYDIFKRINTGGRPLNSQEIRNCMASKTFRLLLKQMATNPEFISATLGGMNKIRMEDIEMALRFFVFSEVYTSSKDLSTYNGEMQSFLDLKNDEYSSSKYQSIYSKKVTEWETAMKNARHLFKEYAFRKITVESLEPGSKRQLLNKALLISWAVVLKDYPNEIIRKLPEGCLIRPLANEISTNNELFQLLSYGTNSRANLIAAFNLADQLIKTVL